MKPVTRIDQRKMLETLREYSHKMRGREADDFEMMRKRDKDDEDLDRLAEESPVCAELVKLRFFAGLTLDEFALLPDRFRALLHADQERTLGSGIRWFKAAVACEAR